MMADMMHRATKVAVLADSSKFGRSLFAQIADLGAADYLITDTPPPAALAAALAAPDVQVLVPGDGS
jgi:DeoR family transcriptional regulator, fructose operon transcriptional repressor